MSASPVSALNGALLAAVCQASGIGPDGTGALARLASGDYETCATVAALIRRAYRAGRAAALADRRGGMHPEACGDAA